MSLIPYPLAQCENHNDLIRRKFYLLRLLFALEQYVLLKFPCLDFCFQQKEPMLQ